MSCDLRMFKDMKNATRIRLTLRNQRGAVDLPSIMVGAIVLGLLTAAILATVFTVIPWAQDNAAKQEVSQVSQAEAVYYARTSDGSGDPHYTDTAGLAEAGLLSSPADPNRLVVRVDNATAEDRSKTDGWALASFSDTGQVFCATSQDPQPVAADSKEDCLPPPRMVSTWNPVLGGKTCTTDTGGAGYLVQLPLLAYNSDAVIDWGDESETTVTEDRHSHCYVGTGLRQVTVEGTVERWGAIPSQWTPRAIISVDLWDMDAGTLSLSNGFNGASNLISVATPPPTVTLMDAMFSGATKFNQPIGHWDTSKVGYMTSMFYKASSFNQPIGNWDTSKVLLMGCMFRDAKAFNQPIGNWDTSSVLQMPCMFQNASSFNQDVSGWNVAKTTAWSGFGTNSSLTTEQIPIKFR